MGLQLYQLLNSGQNSVTVSPMFLMKTVNKFKYKQQKFKIFLNLFNIDTKLWTTVTHLHLKKGSDKWATVWENASVISSTLTQLQSAKGNTIGQDER